MRLTLGSLLLCGTIALASGSTKELTFDGPTAHQKMRSTFADYGVRPRQAVVREKDGVRLTLQKKAEGGQTGVYSLFVVSGDCEVAMTYDLLSVPTPAKGYGSGVGVAFDAGDDVGRGAIQRVEKPGKEGGGYVLQTNLTQNGSPKEEYRFVKATAKRGWFGLRREKGELVFLATEDLATEMKELGRLPFPTSTIRAVRLFADAGGSPTMVDARLGQIRVRADEITGGVPEAERPGWGWWPLAAVAAATAGAALWWHFSRRAG